MKLTNAMKEKIINSIINDTIRDRAKANEKSKHQLADDIYNEFYSVFEQQMASLPENFFQSKRQIEISIGGYYKTMEMSKTRLVGAMHIYGRISVDFKSKHEVRYNQLEKEQNEILKDKRELQQTLQSIINPITTDKKLIEVWPEAEKWIPRTAEAKLNLPALRCDDLNDMIAKMKGEKH